MALAAFFLAAEPLVLHTLSYYRLPLAFIMRFSTFWFCSFILAILAFLFYVRQQAHVIPELDRRRALRLSAYAFSIGTVVAVVVASMFFLAYS